MECILKLDQVVPFCFLNFIPTINYRLLDSKQIEPEPKKDHQWVDMDVSEALTRRRPNRNRVTSYRMI